MGTTNIFWNAYVQAENKLTYNFLCLLEYMPNVSEFANFLLDDKYVFKNEHPKQIEKVFGGYESNPDGKIKLVTSDNREISIYFENKTHRCGLEESQLNNHLRVFCCTPEDVLLVITPRPQDKNIIAGLNNPKVFFKTWQQVSAKLKEINEQQPSFLVAQFVEYGVLSGECVHIESISNREIGEYLRARKTETEEKFFGLFETLRQSLNFNDLGLCEIDSEIKNHWGRFGLEFEFKPKKHNFGQWFFFGIYYDSFDHGLKLESPGVPELAFFFDINPKERERLKQNEGLGRAIKRLCSNGFEENLTVKAANPWRLLFCRQSLKENEELSVERLKNTFDNIYQLLSKDKDFADVMF